MHSFLCGDLCLFVWSKIQSPESSATFRLSTGEVQLYLYVESWTGVAGIHKILHRIWLALMSVNQGFSVKSGHTATSSHVYPSLPTTRNETGFLRYPHPPQFVWIVFLRGEKWYIHISPIEHIRKLNINACIAQEKEQVFLFLKIPNKDMHICPTGLVFQLPQQKNCKTTTNKRWQKLLERPCVENLPPETTAFEKWMFQKFSSSEINSLKILEFPVIWFSFWRDTDAIGISNCFF